MTGFIVSVFPFRSRVSPKEAFEGLELGEGKPSCPVLRGPGGCKAAWLLGNNSVTSCLLVTRPRSTGIVRRRIDESPVIRPFTWAEWYSERQPFELGIGGVSLLVE
jgi:hypothetical protein